VATATVMAMVMAMAAVMAMATAMASAAVAAAMMTVATKKATRTKASSALERTALVDKADERGDAHHHSVASCLNSIDHDVSINASFSFNTI
jgi:hypothetical protein